MANTGKASIKLATAQLLTSSYVVTTIDSYSITEESVATIDLAYKTGTSETGSALNFILEFSYDGVTWTPETYTALVTGTNTLSPMTNAIAGGAGATTYSGQYVVPFCSRNLRVKVKETGVSSNYGTVTVILTVAAASGQERNMQAISIGAPVGGATSAKQDIGNASLASIDGKTPALGQALAASSVPVVLTAAQLSTLTPPAAITGFATSAKQDTLITQTDGIEASLTSIDGKITACNTGAVTIAAALPAGTNLVGKVSASAETSTVYNGTTAISPLFAIIDHATSGDNTIVSADATKKIRVLSCTLVASAAVTVRFESAAGGTALTGQMQLAANGGFVANFSPIGHFETAANQLLNLELSGATSVDGFLTYILV